MPPELQARLMSDFDDLVDRPKSNASLHAAKEWFYGSVANHTRSDEASAETGIYRGYRREKGKTANTDIHYDSAVSRTKYLVVVANTPRIGTLFFPQGSEVHSQRTEDLFSRRKDSLVLKAAFREMGLTYEQLPTGQLCSFDMKDQLHAAAPLFGGDKKINFSTGY